MPQEAACRRGITGGIVTNDAQPMAGKKGRAPPPQRTPSRNLPSMSDKHPVRIGRVLGQVYGLDRGNLGEPLYVFQLPWIPDQDQPFHRISLPPIGVDHARRPRAWRKIMRLRCTRPARRGLVQTSAQRIVMIAKAVPTATPARSSSRKVFRRTNAPRGMKRLSMPFPEMASR